MQTQENTGMSVFTFIQEQIRQLQEEGKERTAHAFSQTFRHFHKFRKGCDLPFGELDEKMIKSYEKSMIEAGLSINTVSFYLRNLRNIFNRAVQEGIIRKGTPFEGAFTGGEKVKEKSLSPDDIRKIRGCKTPGGTTLDFARDMFMFSFYAEGMLLADMAALTRDNLQDRFVVYTGRQGNKKMIRCVEGMRDIIEKYREENTPYLFPIIKDKTESSPRDQLRQTNHNINYHLRKLGRDLKLQEQLTFGMAAYSWNNIAREAKGQLNHLISIMYDL